MRVLKYLLSGVIGISVNLGTLHLLVDSFGVHYLLASILAVSLSTVVGFLMQKYWTFEERTHARAGKQFVLYASIAVLNIGINTAIVYIITGILGFHYLIAQFVGASVVAVWSYFLYRHILFKMPVAPTSAEAVI